MEYGLKVNPGQGFLGPGAFFPWGKMKPITSIIILVESGADINAWSGDEQLTPLMIACDNGKLNTVILPY